LPYYPWYGGDLVEDPLEKATLYFVSHSKGLYRSDDGAARWASTSRSCSRDCLAKAYVGAAKGDYFRLAVDPSRPTRLYAGMPYGVYRSIDGGDHWRRVIKLDRGWLDEGLAVASDGTVYASGTKVLPGTQSPVVTVARSDGGNWKLTLRFKARPAGAAYLAAGPLAIDPNDPEVVLAAVAAGNSGGAPVCVRLFKTTNGGRTWAPADRGLVPSASGCQ
jgi:photosystem II stability/assembly factor-like uncharacterized protein